MKEPAAECPTDSLNGAGSPFGIALADVGRKLATLHADGLPDPVFELGRLARRQRILPERAVVEFRRVWDREVRDAVREERHVADGAKVRATELLLDGYFADH